MAAPDEVWFVQLQNVGTILGPMPLDALTEMARTGVLLPHDLVRRQESSEWQSAAQLSDLSGQFAVFVPSDEVPDVVLSDDDSLTLPEEISPPEPLMTPAHADLNHLLEFAGTGPSTNAIVFDTAPSLPREPVAEKICERDVETVAKATVDVSSELVAYNMLVAAEPTAPPTPPEMIHNTASVTENNSQLDKLADTNLPPWSPSTSPTRPTPLRYTPKRARRGPLALARFSSALPNFFTLLSKPIDKRLVAAITVLALLAWYFNPFGRPVRRPPPQTAEVAGVIRLNGQPVSNALVLFRPDRSQGTIGPPSMGKTDTSGQFKLTINNSHLGAVVGKHQVAVRSSESAGYSPDSPVLSASVPERYAQIETSRLVAEVLPDQLNEISLDLTSN